MVRLNKHNRDLLERASAGLWGQAIKSWKTEIRQPRLILQEVRLSEVVGVVEKHE